MKKDAPYLAALCLSAGLFLSPALLTSRVLLPGDLLTNHLPWGYMVEGVSPNNVIISDVLEQFFPYHHFWRSEIFEGRLPLWNPYSQNGTPFLANSVSGVFSPIKWLLLLVPPTIYYEVSAFLKLFLAGVGVFLFCRRIGLSRGGSLASALVYQFAGYNVFFLLFPNTFISALLGWGLLCLESYFQSRKRLYLAAFAVVVAVSYLGGHMECALLHHMAYGLYALIRQWRKLMPVAAATLLGCLMAGVALVPFVDLMFRSGSLDERSYVGRNPYYLPPSGLPSVVLPHHKMPQEAGLRPPTRFSRTGFVYIGIVPIFLAFAGLAGGRRDRRVLPMVALGSWSFAILVGFPLIFDVFTWLPVLRYGNHIHIVQIFHMSVAILAGIGVDALVSGKLLPNRRRIVLGTSVALLVVASLPGLLRLVANGSDFFFLRWNLSYPLAPVLASSSLAMVVLLVQRIRVAKIAGMAVCAVLFISALLTGAFFNTSIVPKGNLSLVPPIADFMRENPHGRLATVGHGAFPPNLGMLWGIRDYRGYETLRVDRYLSFASLAEEFSDFHFFLRTLDQRILAVLRRAGCSFVMSPTRLNLEGLERVVHDAPYIYRIKDGSRLTIPDSIHAVSSGDEALEALRASAYSSSVILEGAGLDIQTSPGSATWVTDLPDLVQVKVSMTGPGWLVLRDTYDSGWVATVDGVDAPILRADYLFRAVRLDRGDHLVQFAYRPWSFRWGAGMSLLGLLILLGTVLPHLASIQRASKAPSALSQ